MSSLILCVSSHTKGKATIILKWLTKFSPRIVLFVSLHIKELAQAHSKRGSVTKFVLNKHSKTFAVWLKANVSLYIVDQ